MIYSEEENDRIYNEYRTALENLIKHVMTFLSSSKLPQDPELDVDKITKAIIDNFSNKNISFMTSEIDNQFRRVYSELEQLIELVLKNFINEDNTELLCHISSSISDMMSDGEFG